jgi:hypothetical protein
VPATPDCTGGSAFQVCVHPAFGFYLSDVAAALEPVGAEIAGLPGAPVRAEEVASVSGGLTVMGGTSGNPPVFQFTAEHVGNMFGAFNGIPDAAMWRQAFGQALLGAFLGAPAQQAAPAQPAGPGTVPTPAQQAVANGLLIAVGSHPSLDTSLIAENGKPDAATWDAISAAAQRFARLSASARHAWLATHLAALRAGPITVAQVP